MPDLTDGNRNKRAGHRRERCPDVEKLLSWADGTLVESQEWYDISKHATGCQLCGDLSRRYLGLLLELADIRPSQHDARRIYQAALADVAGEREQMECTKRELNIASYGIEGAIGARASMIRIPASKYEPAEILDRDPE